MSATKSETETPQFCSEGRNCYENCRGWDCTCACHCSSEGGVLFQIKIARDQALCDAIKEVERLYDEWWDVDRRRWLNIVLERLKALRSRREGNNDAE